MVNKLHHLEALVICDTFLMNGGFGELDSHPSLQTIKLMAKMSTCKSLVSVLRLWQLQELWIGELRVSTHPQGMVSSSPVSLNQGQQTNTKIAPYLCK